MKGPFGCGGEQYPSNKQLNSPPSGLNTVKYARDSSRFEGSKRIFSEISVPSNVAAGYASIIKYKAISID